MHVFHFLWLPSIQYHIFGVYKSSSLFYNNPVVTQSIDVIRSQMYLNDCTCFDIYDIPAVL